MLSRFACCLSALVLALVSPLAAKTVYIPLTGQQLVGTTPLEVRVVISNHGTTPASVKHFFVAAGADGTERSGTAPSVDVAAGQTIVLTRPAADRGLFELSGPDELAYAAHLAAVGEPSRFLALPVITARIGLSRGGHPLSPGPAARRRAADRCGAGEHGLLRGGVRHRDPRRRWRRGRLAGHPEQAAAAQQPPDRQRARLAADRRRACASRSPATSPSTPSPWWAASRGASGSAWYAPGRRANFGISHEPEGPAGCPAGATCFDRAGLVHKPTPVAPVKRLSIPVPPGSYRRIHLRMDVKHGGWASGKANGRHHLFWLVRNKNLDMIANGDFYGPNANYLDLQHGIGLVHEAKIHLVKENFMAQPGATYHFDYVYDVGARFLELVVTQGGAQVARLRGVPNVTEFVVGSSDEIILDLGFDGSNPAEPPTYNWQYQNIEVDFVP